MSSMFEFIRSLVLTIATVILPAPTPADDQPCSPSYCCDAAWENCRAANKNGTCPDGKLQGWCINCYTGASDCGPDGTRCCD